MLRQENWAITMCDLHGARFSSTTQFILVILTIIFIIIIVIKPLQKRSDIDLRNRTKPKSELFSISDIYASVTRYTMEINPVYLSAQKHSLWKWYEHHFGTNIFGTFRWSNNPFEIVILLSQSFSNFKKHWIYFFDNLKRNSSAIKFLPFEREIQ